MSYLEEAFDFLFEFKAGNAELELPMNPKHVESIRLLSMDLLAKSVDVSRMSEREINTLLSEIAGVDSRWNNSLQECLDRAYRLADQNLMDEAAILLNSFAGTCPSDFYKEIAFDVKDEILGSK